jgi:putative tricarboxylic transport membrane protein
MEKIELRKKDYLTSLILVAFGLFVIFYTLFTMPMKDSFSGVVNVWYVSPGLFPLCIGAFIAQGGLVLMARAMRDGGARKFWQDFSAGKKESSGKTLRLLAILLPIFSYVYLNIPRVDFFLSTIFCLIVFTTLFYFDRQEVLKKLFLFYLVGCLVFLLLFSAGVHHSLNEFFPYFTDGLVFLFLLAYIYYCLTLIQGDSAQRRKLRLTLLTSLLTSLVLIPSFKYFLLVPLPVEGGFIEIMNVIRYAFR